MSRLIAMETARCKRRVHEVVAVSNAPASTTSFSAEYPPLSMPMSSVCIVTTCWEPYFTITNLFSVELCKR